MSYLGMTGEIYDESKSIFWYEEKPAAESSSEDIAQ
jgi:hypothetical protein